MENKVMNICTNNEVVKEIQQIQSDPDTNYGYRKMSYCLQQMGYIINHKKVYRLMGEYDLLHDKRVKPPRNFVKYRKVMSQRPFEVLEMDIKFVWVEEYKRHAYIITVIDTFTRFCLNWKVSYHMGKEQVKQLWCKIIVNRLQSHNCLKENIRIEVRNDKDNRFLARIV